MTMQPMAAARCSVCQSMVVAEEWNLPLECAECAKDECPKCGASCTDHPGLFYMETGTENTPRGAYCSICGWRGTISEVLMRRENPPSEIPIADVMQWKAACALCDTTRQLKDMTCSASAPSGWRCNDCDDKGKTT